MTRRQNRAFLIAGATGFLTIPVFVVILKTLNLLGYDIDNLTVFVEKALPLILFPSFIFLGWLGLLPALSTRLYVRSDPNNYYYLTSRHSRRGNWDRFIWLIEDDPRVITKEREYP